MADATVTALRPERITPRRPKVTSAPAPKAARRRSAREWLTIAGAVGMGIVALGGVAVSLSDLAEAIGEVAKLPAWKAAATAALLDGGFISVEVWSLFAPAPRVRATRIATGATKVVTLGMSAVANAWMMSRGADTVVLAIAGATAGVAVPGLVAAMTLNLGRAVRG